MYHLQSSGKTTSSASLWCFLRSSRKIRQSILSVSSVSVFEGIFSDCNLAKYCRTAFLSVSSTLGNPRLQELQPHIEKISPTRLALESTIQSKISAVLRMGILQYQLRIHEGTSRKKKMHAAPRIVGRSHINDVDIPYTRDPDAGCCISI